MEYLTDIVKLVALHSKLVSRWVLASRLASLLAPTGALIVMIYISTHFFIFSLSPLTFQELLQVAIKPVSMQLVSQESNVKCQMKNVKYQMSIMSNLLSERIHGVYPVIFISGILILILIDILDLMVIFSLPV